MHNVRSEVLHGCENVTVLRVITQYCLVDGNHNLYFPEDGDSMCLRNPL
jgi:hypothetical protein